MKGALAAAVAVLAVTLSLTAVYAEPSHRLADAEVYSVVYETNGGTLADGPDSYVAGSYLPLPVPERDGYLFGGWCTGPDLTDPMGGILPGTRGDVVLYALWIEDGRVGTGWTMEVDGEYRNGDIPHTVSGTVTYRYLAERDGRILLVQSRDVTYSWPGDSWTDTSVTSSWIGGICDGWTYAGCADGGLTVWESDGSTMWVRDMSVIVGMESPIGTDGTVVYGDPSGFGFRPSASYVPSVSCEYPLRVDAPGSVRIGEPLTLTARGEGFDGWYLNGRLVSSDPTVTIDLPRPTDVLEARSSHGFEVVDDGRDIASLGFGGGSFTDSDGDPVDVSGMVPGLYHGTASTNGVTRTIDIVVEDERTFRVEWEWDGRTYSYEDTVLLSDSLRPSYDIPNLPRFSMRSQSHIESFYTPDDPYLQRIASALAAMGAGMDRNEFAGFVLRFVQTVPYIEDSASRGTEEFWKLPVETLWDGGGDCEDKTFLYGALMGLSGYRTAFLLFMDHAMAAVTLDAPGFSADIEGYRFVLCETTNTAFSIGQTSSGHFPGNALYACRIECF